MSLSIAQTPPIFFFLFGIELGFVATASKLQNFYILFDFFFCGYRGEGCMQEAKPGSSAEGGIASGKRIHVFSAEGLDWAHF
jgi:hypothetical protein